MYNKLIRVLSYCLDIGRKKNITKIVKKCEYTINVIFYHIDNDNNVVCYFTFCKNNINLFVFVFVTFTIKSRK